MITRAFVDGFEEGVARLAIDGRTVNLPRKLLPKNAREGSWVEIAIQVIDPSPSEKDDAEAIRKKLSADDDGGDLKL